MNQHFPVLIVVVPLLSALILFAASWVNKKICFPLAVFSLSVSLYSAVGVLLKVLATGAAVEYKLAGWAAPIGIVYKVDFLNGIVLVVVAAVALLNLLGTKKNVSNDFPDRIGAFYSLYILFVTGLLGIVVTGDAFNLYVLLEIASLTGYALIGLGEDRSALSSLNYLFMGTIGATFYLLGVGYLYIATGTLNMADIAAILPSLFESKIVLFAFLICISGFFMKMAFFPFHIWLPNAYSFAPPASIGVIASLTTKVMIYVMIRICLYVFTPDFVFTQIHVSNTIVWLAVIAIIMGSLCALAQRNLKRMLTYIIVVEVGYMVGGFWLANRAGITGAALHIVNDAVMTLCAFMALGAIMYKTGSDSFDDLQGLFKKMPFSMIALVIAGMSIIGIPPTCGFFSKWYLISGGIAAKHYGFVTALLFSSLVNAILFFRIFEIAHFEPFTDHHGHSDAHGSPHDVAAKELIDDAPVSMLIPLLLVASSLIILGVYSGDIVNYIIKFAIPAQIL